MLKRKCQQPEDVAKAIETLQSSAGIEMADRLSIEHIRESIVNLTEIRQGTAKVIDIQERHAQALIALALKVKTRKN